MPLSLVRMVLTVRLLRRGLVGRFPSPALGRRRQPGRLDRVLNLRGLLRLLALGLVPLDRGGRLRTRRFLGARFGHTERRRSRRVGRW